MASSDVIGVLTIFGMLFVYSALVNPDGLGEMMKSLQKAIDDFARWVNRL